MQEKWQETRVSSLSQKDSLEKEMATHSSFLAWEIPWTEEPGGSMGSQESDTTEHVHAHYSAARSEDVEACVLRNHRTEKPDVKEYFSQWPKWRDISQSHHHLQNVYDYRPKGKDV